jgi:hypothetical protein
MKMLVNKIAVKSVNPECIHHVLKQLSKRKKHETSNPKILPPSADICMCMCGCKSKVELLTLCYAGSKGKRRYSSYSFSTSALERGEWSASRPDLALPPCKDPRCPLYRRLGGPESWSGHRG